MKPREVERLIEREGWIYVPGVGKGGHRAYRHPDKGGLVVIPWHTNREVATGTVFAILRDAGIKRR
jgi:predicted RNA binding protein YcfA (HicA-like mRNA interferase family)